MELTLSNDKRRIEEEVAHKLSRKLTKKVGGNCSIEKDSPILYSVDQRHSRGGVCLRDTQNLRKDENKYRDQVRKITWCRDTRE